ncbi:cysteine dioxygenase family protein [Stigmatella sp. ncwal1]|uniref:Cysteine dioxygenase family protein n=1 Tax=Stigmatella ashevillensis TaxID=2995309 RepID=A0ABT5DHK1_9BACT|nr:cysteine dioxygenase family protein [Stigmatella ashevillena]MDC0711812.1 cysteine dioxygenase family protein [Stigmatella ashevillena]
MLRQLREEVHGAEGELRVGERLRDVRVRPECLKPYLHFRRGRYTRNLVYREPRFEVVVNCWDEGTASPIHDHDAQECWFSIQAGRFLLENFPLLSGGREAGPAVLGPPQVSEPVGPGHVDFRGPDDSIHRVSVLSGPGVSLHVYASPVEQCLVFDPRRQRCEWYQLSYYSVFGRPVKPLRPAELSERR